MVITHLNAHFQPSTEVYDSCRIRSLGGSTAASAVAAGIIALALEANPTLGWRDMQHIIVRTSKRQLLRADDWQTNAAGFEYSHVFGFGLMDAEAMVRLAEQWSSVYWW